MKIIYFISAIILLSFNSSFAATLARIANKTITETEFKHKYKQIKSSSFNPPTPGAVLEDSIRFSIGIQEANKENVKNSPKFKQRMEQELYKFYLEKHLSRSVQAIKIKPSAMKRYYYQFPEIRTSHILISIKPNANLKQVRLAKKRAKQIYNDVKKSKKPFAELVHLYTDDAASKTRNGDLGYQTRVTLVPNYYNAAKKLKLNKISAPIQTPYGLHIIKLTGIKKYSQANKQYLKAAVFDIQRAKIFNAFFKKLKKRYAIKVNNKLLKKIK
ncbi:MAG: hypothetical protein HAW63_00215 [Bdellovibrionaceae bacterium]|nr:hypothetical protein [Pseudobdellovibrionaceae bacterium]